jgi:GT2 family glycosyltransferase
MPAVTVSVMNRPVPLQSVSIIIVGYQSCEDLKTLLPCLVEHSPVLGTEIVVIDNGSTDGTRHVLEKYKDTVTVIYNSENMGFAAAVNQGFRESGAPYVLLLNPDARLDAHGIYTLKTYLDDHPSVAAVAPRMEFPDGRLQPSRGSFPSVFRTIAHLFRLKRLMPRDEKVIRGPLKILGSAFGQYAPLPETDQTVDYTTGACVLMRRSAVDEIGGLDDNFFLYYEEIDLARRLRNEGYTWVFLNTVSAVHTVAASSSRSPLRPFYERYKSMCYYFRKHHHALSAFVVRQLLYVMVFFRWGCVLINKRFRLDPDTPLSAEIAMYKQLVRPRARPAPKDP